MGTLYLFATYADKALFVSPNTKKPSGFSFLIIFSTFDSILEIFSIDELPFNFKLYLGLVIFNCLKKILFNWVSKILISIYKYVIKTLSNFIYHLRQSYYLWSSA